jgi:hypothetical protein
MKKVREREKSFWSGDGVGVVVCLFENCSKEGKVEGAQAGGRQNQTTKKLLNCVQESEP